MKVDFQLITNRGSMTISVKGAVNVLFRVNQVFTFYHFRAVNALGK